MQWVLAVLVFLLVAFWPDGRVARAYRGPKGTVSRKEAEDLVDPTPALNQRDYGDETGGYGHDAVPEGLGIPICPVEVVVPVETLDASALQALLEIRVAQDKETTT